nr:hypothetical protein [Tanacetum cinerariifolium]
MSSFTKLFNINTPHDSPLISKLLGFTTSGEPTKETEKDYGEFATVEVNKPCSEHINDLGINGETGSFFICPYTEMLLLIDHSDCCIVSNDYYVIASPSATQRLLLGLLEAPPSWTPDAIGAVVQFLELPRNWMQIHFLRAIGTAMSIGAGIAAAALLF